MENNKNKPEEMGDGQSPTKEITEGVGYFLGIVFFGFLFAMGALVLLGMLLEGTLGIDITEFDGSYRLILITWGICTVGYHLYLNNQEEKLIQEQLDTLRRKGVVQFPHPKLNERYNQEQKADEDWKKYVEKRREMESDPRSSDPFYISDKFNPNYQKLMEERKLKETKPPKQ